MGGAVYARSGVLYHGTDPTNSLLLPLWRIGRAALSPAGGRPFAGQGRLYSTPAALFVHQPGNWTFIVEDDQSSRCRTEKVSTRQLDFQIPDGKAGSHRGHTGSQVARGPGS